jgi:hypothetical protein
MSSGCAKPSIRSFVVSRLSCALAAVALVAGGAMPRAGGADPRLADGLRIEVVATAVPRPAQLAFTASGRLVVLSSGWRGDSAAEIFWLDPSAGTPIDAAPVPRVVIPFADGPRKTALGSLGVHPRTDDLYLGEENGNRIYRWGADKRLAPVVVGLNHLLGGSSFAIDQFGRLAVLDYASFESQLRSEVPPPPSLAWLATEDYQGPLVFRVDPDADVPLPRRLELIAPIFPRPPLRKATGEPLNKFIAVVARAGGELTLLSSVGEVFVLTSDAILRRLTRLPSGHFNRTSLAVAPDGSVYVSSGFHIREVYRVSPTGAVTSVASGLGDPQGIAVDATGALYIAETALHRIIRLR